MEFANGIVCLVDQATTKCFFIAFFNYLLFKAELAASRHCSFPTRPRPKNYTRQFWT